MCGGQVRTAQHREALCIRLCGFKQQAVISGGVPVNRWSTRAPEALGYSHSSQHGHLCHRKTFYTFGGGILGGGVVCDICAEMEGRRSSTRRLSCRISISHLQCFSQKMVISHDIMNMVCNGEPLFQSTWIEWRERKRER